MSVRDNTQNQHKSVIIGGGVAELEKVSTCTQYIIMFMSKLGIFAFSYVIIEVK